MLLASECDCAFKIPSTKHLFGNPHKCKHEGTVDDRGFNPGAVSSSLPQWWFWSQSERGEVGSLLVAGSGIPQADKLREPFWVRCKPGSREEETGGSVVKAILSYLVNPRPAWAPSGSVFSPTAVSLEGTGKPMSSCARNRILEWM